MELIYKYLGNIEYPKAIQLLEDHFPRALEEKQGFMFALEHPLVYTSGLRTEKNHIVNPNLKITPARRGGSITLHNPGQLVVYFVVPLSETPGLETLVRRLEGAIIETLWEYGVFAFTNPPHSGVFTKEGKIGFIGLGLKKNTVYHGIAINLNNNLNDYKEIYSCGLNLPITRLKDLSQESISLSIFAEKLASKIQNRFSQFGKVVYKTASSISIKNLNFPFAGFRIGQLFFNERRYWHAHETWEHSWHDYREYYGKENKTDYIMFLHGIIQLAMATYRMYEVVAINGAISLLGKSMEKLEKNPYWPRYIKNHSALFAWMQDALQQLNKGIIPEMPPQMVDNFSAIKNNAI
ncbi:MAG: Octanoyltransferase [Turneriella sp.]|nr:Octanoyltransferase [Turneriella sp.]